jgi:seryl-tRNA synthetase
LKDIKTQLLSQASHISSLRASAELDSMRSKYYPFQNTRWKLESGLHSVRFERDANERERKKISLRKSIEELEAQEQQLSHKLNQFQEEEDDIMATAHEIGKTILAINYPDLWLSYFENARSVRRNEGGLPKGDWYGE